MGLVRPVDLDDWIAECDRRGGLDAPASFELRADFQLAFATPIDRTLDPFSDAYFQQQLALYREITGRELDQTSGELMSITVADHVQCCNPYDRPQPAFITQHARAIHTALMLADLPMSPSILDLGSGWGLSSEMMAFAGADVTAVDINPLFTELIAARAARLSLPIRAIQSDFDTYVDERQYDLVFFYECLHHSLRPWDTLQRATRWVKPGGKIVWAGEPVNNVWWEHWGLRLDFESIYCMRKFGWWESGWSSAFITRCFERCGYTLTLVSDVGLYGGPIGFAVPHELATSVRPNLSVAPWRNAHTELTQRAAALEQEVRELQHAMAAMRDSWSWRLAGPIRKLGRSWRSLFGRTTTT